MRAITSVLLLAVGALSESLERNILGTSLVTGQIVADSAKWGIRLTKNKQVVDFANDVAGFGDASSDALKIEVENTHDYLQEIVAAIEAENAMYFENIAASQDPDVLAFASDFAQVKAALVALNTQFQDTMNFKTHSVRAINDVNTMFSDARADMSVETLNALVAPVLGLALHIKELATETKDILFLRQNRQDSEQRWKTHGKEIIAHLRYAACNAYRSIYVQRIALNTNLRAVFRNNEAIPVGSAAAKEAQKVWELQCSQFATTQPNCQNAGTNPFWQQRCAAIVNVVGDEQEISETVNSEDPDGDEETVNSEDPSGDEGTPEETSGTPEETSEKKPEETQENQVVPADTFIELSAESGEFSVEKQVGGKHFCATYQQVRKGMVTKTGVSMLAQYRVKRNMDDPKTFNPQLKFSAVKSRGPFHNRDWSSVALNDEADKKRRNTEFLEDLKKDTDAGPETPALAAHKRAAEFLPGTCPDPQEYARLLEVCRGIASSPEKQDAQTEDERAGCPGLLDSNNQMLSASKKLPSPACDAYWRLTRSSKPLHEECPICIEPMKPAVQTAPAAFLEGGGSTDEAKKKATGALQKLAAKVAYTCDSLCPASTDEYNMWASTARASDLPDAGSTSLTFSQCELYSAKYEETPKKKLMYIQCVENTNCAVCPPRPVPVDTKLPVTPTEPFASKDETLAKDYEEWKKNAAPLLEFKKDAATHAEDGYYQVDILMQKHSMAAAPIIRIESDTSLAAVDASAGDSSFLEVRDGEDSCAGLIANPAWNNIDIVVQRKGDESEGLHFRVGGWVSPIVQTQTQAIRPAKALSLCYRNDFSMRLPDSQVIMNMENVRIPNAATSTADWDIQIVKATPTTMLDAPRLTVHVTALSLDGGEPCQMTLVKATDGAFTYVADAESSAAMKVVNGEPATVSLYIEGPVVRTKIGTTQVVHFNPMGGTRTLKFETKSGISIGLEYSQAATSKDGVEPVLTKPDNQTVTLSSTEVQDEANAAAKEASEQPAKDAVVVVGHGTADPPAEAPIVVNVTTETNETNTATAPEPEVTEEPDTVEKTATTTTPMETPEPPVEVTVPTVTATATATATTSDTTATVTAAAASDVESVPGTSVAI